MSLTELFFISVLTLAVSILILYFVIKSAIKEALREFGKENRSIMDIGVKQTKLLSEIAKANGISQESINNIISPDVEYSFQN